MFYLVNASLLDGAEILSGGVERTLSLWDPFDENLQGTLMLGLLIWISTLSVGQFIAIDGAEITASYPVAAGRAFFFFVLIVSVVLTIAHADVWFQQRGQTQTAAIARATMIPFAFLMQAYFDHWVSERFEELKHRYSDIAARYKKNSKVAASLAVASILIALLSGAATYAQVFQEEITPDLVRAATFALDFLIVMVELCLISINLVWPAFVERARN